MVNRVILIGRLGADPETRYTPSGLAVTTISLATNERWRDPESGETKERTEWHRVVFFGKLAEIAGQYLRKGRQVYVEGSIRTRKWQDQEGKERYVTEIVASALQMLDSRTDVAAAVPPGEPASQTSSPPGDMQESSRDGKRPPQSSQSATWEGQNPDALSDDVDDDIPF